ncbi:MAG TPA: TonB-dependent receptor [Vicinamibacterales bacterium]|nr:TonB-dependent receptor [Vicinamibacterales bacterium]
MRLRSFAALVAIALLATPALAQEQRGSIEGVVKDASGAVLPGATVTLTGGAGVSLDAVSDSSGIYRFPSLLPGTYTATANLSGFSAGKVQNVLVELGQVKKVDFALAVAGVSENVKVTAEAPLVDVKQSTKATNISAERIDLVPHNRDFTSMVTQAPGANQENKSNGISIDGASAAENRYVIDGVETTSIFNGLSAKPVLSDFIQEIQVKSSGYPAEFGGSTGAVINVITKSGTNSFSGNALTYWQGSALTGTCRRPSLAPINTTGAVTGTTIAALADNSPVPCGANPTLRLTLTNSNAAQFWTFPKDTSNRYEPGGSIGGPILQNRMWFFGGYQPALTTVKRTVNATTSGNGTAATLSETQHLQVQYVTADQTMQLGSKLRTRVAFNNSWSKTNGQLPALSGVDPVTTNYARGTVSPNWSLSGVADYNVTSNFLVGFRAGYFRSNAHDFGVPSDTRFVFNASNIGDPGVPASEQHPGGYSNIPTNSATVFNILDRKFLQADATWFTHARGEHQIKGGVQFDLRGNNVNSGDQAQTVSLDWDSQYDPAAPQGVFGYYEVRSNAALPREGFITQGNVKSNVAGLFLQDTWSVSNNLTLNLGVRTEQEKVPAYTSSNNAYGQYPIKFGFGDKVAPRLGAAYDVNGDGRWKVYGSWGMFYDIFKLDLGQESFGGAKWIQWYFTLDTPNFETLNQNTNCPPACAGTFISSVDERLPSLSADACGGPCISNAIKPMRSQEATVGLEHQLGGNSSVTFRYVHKQLDRGIEDTGSIDPATNNEPYIIGNPGEGPTATFNIVNCNAAPGVPTCDVYAGSSGAYKLPKPNRKYDAGEVTYQKRFSHNWSLFGSYTLSRLNGNYPGLAESDEAGGTGVGRVSPNIGRLFDYPLEQFDGQGRALYGDLPTDRTHQVKGQLVYSFPFGTTIGLSQYVASGIPISRSIGVIPGHGYLLYFNGRGSEGRTPVLSQSDLFVQHEIKLGSTGKRVVVNATVLNLFDQRTILDYSNGIRRTGTFPSFSETAFYAGQVNMQSLIDAVAFPNGGLRVDPRFLMPRDFQSPLVVRFGAKFTF